MYTVGDQLVEAIRLHLPLAREAARTRAVQLLARVGIPGAERRMDAYSFQLSGGMCQRVMIAIAPSCDPELLIADEPTTALDVTTQARILDLLTEIQASAVARAHGREGQPGWGRRGGAFPCRGFRPWLGPARRSRPPGRATLGEGVARTSASVARVTTVIAQLERVGVLLRMRSMAARMRFRSSRAGGIPGAPEW
ncbi:hypothetical protein GCM10010400_36560 [Streptomyces aculeolatus]